MDLNACEEKGFVRITNKNSSLVKSLLEMSEMKEKVVSSTILDDSNICAFIPMAYDSLREILEAICVMNGYKVTSHICIDKLLETIYLDCSFTEFDRFRYIRNSINYYGKKISLEAGRQIIKKIFKFREKMITILKQG